MGSVPDHDTSNNEPDTSGSAMRIKSIKIKNFRSYEEAELDCTNFNILVGRNNHGKSNFIEALEWFYEGKASLEDIRRNGAGNDDHIEAIAKSYHSYRKQIEDLDDKDQKLLGLLLETAIRAIGSNSAETLEKNHGENPPIKNVIDGVSKPLRNNNS